MSVRRAREIRKESTETEKILWQYLRNHQLNGYKFRRQHPVLDYVVDFYCAEKKLVIEIDGPVHLDKESREYDTSRTEILNESGMKVIRFKNKEIIESINSVLERINNEL